MLEERERGLKRLINNNDGKQPNALSAGWGVGVGLGIGLCLHRWIVGMQFTAREKVRQLKTACA